MEMESHFILNMRSVYEFAVCMNLFTTQIHILSKGIKLGKKYKTFILDSPSNKIQLKQKISSFFHLIWASTLCQALF